MQLEFLVGISITICGFGDQFIPGHNTWIGVLWTLKMQHGSRYHHDHPGHLWDEAGSIRGHYDFAWQMALRVHSSPRVEPVEEALHQQRLGFCSRCGLMKSLIHNCPASGKRCAKCLGRGHFARVCYSRGRSGPSRMYQVCDKVALR